MAVTVLWAWSTALTSAGPGLVPIPRLTRNLLTDYGRLAGTVTGSVPAMFTVDALIFAVCFAVAGYRRRHR
jgi:hypothetical protein